LRVESHRLFQERDVMDAIWSMVYQLFGEIGASQTAMNKIAWESERKILVVRCSHKMLEMVKAAVATVTVVDETDCAIRVLAISGTLKALRGKLSKQSL
jgi:RNase P/RNase MRP subunit POP5